MNKTVVFLEQQSWLGGAQRVLKLTLDSLRTDYECIVAFPGEGEFRSGLEASGVRTIDFPIGHYGPGRKSWTEMAAFAWRSLYCGVKLALFIRKAHVALVYINGPRCLPAGVLAAWLTGRSAALHLHLILNRKLELLLVARSAQYVSKILTCSHAAALSLSKANPGLSTKTQVLYSPLREFGPGSDMPVRPVLNRFTIGVVGRITEEKGHHVLLRATRALPFRLRSKIRILVVGSVAPECRSDLDFLKRLRAEADRLGLQDHVEWVGYQTDPGPYYASMDVLLHPSVSEGMGVVILEALQRGVPVIASRTGGIPEVVQDGVNGLLVPAGDNRALGRALVLFFENRNLRERLRAGARAGPDSRFSPASFSSAIRSAIGDLCTPTSTSESEVAAAGTRKR